MENTVAEEMYDFTKNRREKINLELSKIRSLYGREDVVYRFNAYKKAKDKDTCKKKNAVQSFEGCKKEAKEPSKAVHSTLKEVQETGSKVLCFAQKNFQEEWSGVMSWIMGSIAKPCMSQ